MHHMIRIIQTADSLSFVLLNDTGFASLSEDDKLNVVRSHCIHRQWGLTPARPDDLTAAAIKVDEHTRSIGTQLGTAHR